MFFTTFIFHKPKVKIPMLHKYQQISDAISEKLLYPKSKSQSTSFACHNVTSVFIDSLELVQNN